jgi:histidinol-phosphate phosphatase family protein
MGNRAVFLDRDGTIAKDVPYCGKVEDFELLPSVTDAIALFNSHNFKVVIVTNQSGIARGYFTEETLGSIHNKMIKELEKFEARVDTIHYCPHHPDDGCECRKPKTALFRQAAEELNIDLERSFVVGDMPMDVSAGRDLGCRTVLVTTGPNGGMDIVDAPDYTASNLLEAAQWIVKQSP